MLSADVLAANPLNEADAGGLLQASQVVAHRRPRGVQLLAASVTDPCRATTVRP
jgi:hypothetical protein